MILYVKIQFVLIFLQSHGSNPDNRLITLHLLKNIIKQDWL